MWHNFAVFCLGLLYYAANEPKEARRWLRIVFFAFVMLYLRHS